jgi:flagellar biosynthesis/type III secretory pathway protein FliH
VLWALRDARTIQRFYERLVTWAEELDQLAQKRPDDFATLMRYIWSVAGDEPLETIQKRIIDVAPATEQAMASAAQQLIQQGIQQGKTEGEARGKAESVLAIFEARGLTVSAEQRAQILESKNVDELDRWLRKAVTAASAAELFSH